MNFIANGKRLVIEQFEAETKTKSGIILTESSIEKSNLAKIINISHECKTHWCVGMQVMFNKFGAMPIKLEEKEYLLIDEDKILGYYE